MTTLDQPVALLGLVSAALSRAVVQIGNLPPLVWKPLLRRLKGCLTASLLESATPPDGLPDIACTLLDHLMADQELLEVHRISILIHGSFDGEGSSQGDK